MRVGHGMQFFLAASCAMVGSAAPEAHAADGSTESPTLARLDVTAAPQCANESTFADAMRRRTDRVRIVGSAAHPARNASETKSATPVIEVAMRPARQGAVVGEVRVVREGRASEWRRIAGASCEEVTHGLSLVAAVAFDPMAKTDLPSEAGSDARSAPSSQPGPASQADAERTTDDDAPPSSSSSAGETSRAEQTNASDDRTHASRLGVDPRLSTPGADRGRSLRTAPSAWTFKLGGSTAGMALGATATTFAWGGFIEVERDRAGFSPALRVGAMRASATTEAGSISTSLEWTLARTTICPYRFDVVDRVGLRPCALVDAGVVVAEAAGLMRARSRSRAWVSPGLLGRLTWAPLRMLFLEVEGGASAPLVRDDFSIDPSLSVYRAPTLVPFAQIGAGLRFP